MNRLKGVMGRRQFLRICAAAALIGQSKFALALTVQPPSLADAFAAADIVAWIEVHQITDETSEGEKCGYKFAANILELFKGDRTSQEITFGRAFGDLKAGNRYVLFLHYVGEERVQALYESVPEEMRRTKTQDQGLRIVRCNGLIPGLEYEPLLIFQTDVDRAQYVGIIPRDWPDTINIYRESTGDGITQVSLTGLKRYLHSLAQ